MIHRPSLLLGLGIAASLAIGGQAIAQQEDTTPTPSTGDFPFQTVNVGGYAFTVDPFYLVGCFIVQRTETLGQDSTIKTQCFVRSGEAMTELPAFTTSDTGIAEHVEVGEAMYGYPQVAAPVEDGHAPTG